MLGNSTAQKMKFPIEDSYSKCYQILNEEEILENFIFYTLPHILLHQAESIKKLLGKFIS